MVLVLLLLRNPQIKLLRFNFIEPMLGSFTTMNSLLQGDESLFIRFEIYHEVVLEWLANFVLHYVHRLQKLLNVLPHLKIAHKAVDFELALPFFQAFIVGSRIDLCLFTLAFFLLCFFLRLLFFLSQPERLNVHWHWHHLLHLLPFVSERIAFSHSLFGNTLRWLLGVRGHVAQAFWVHCFCSCLCFFHFFRDLFLGQLRPRFGSGPFIGDLCHHRGNARFFLLLWRWIWCHWCDGRPRQGRLFRRFHHPFVQLWLTFSFFLHMDPRNWWFDKNMRANASI